MENLSQKKVDCIKLGKIECSSVLVLTGPGELILEKAVCSRPKLLNL